MVVHGVRGNAARPDQIVSNNSVRFMGSGPNFGFSIGHQIFRELKLASKTEASILAGLGTVSSTNQLDTVVGLSAPVAPQQEANFKGAEFLFVPVIDASVALN